MYRKTSIFYKIIYLFSLFASIMVLSQSNEQLLKELDQVLAQKDIYVKQKRSKIKELNNDLHKNLLKNNQIGQYEDSKKLFQEYRTFKYDSAYYFVEKSKIIAKQLRDPEKISEAKISEAFVLLSSGLFKEAIDTLNAIKPAEISNPLKYRYYITNARAYSDLADYNKDERYSLTYIQKGNLELEEANKYVQPNSNEYWYMYTLQLLKQQDLAKAEKAFIYWLNHFKLPPSYYGIATSSLGYIYSERGDSDKAMHYLILAAIADVKNATKETVALRNLANELYKKGRYEKANEYISIAMDDATFYNARHRKFEISSILPIIEKTQMNKVNEKKNLLLIVSSILGTLLIVTSILLWKRSKQLKERNISKSILDKSLSKYKEINKSLSEANSIKEEYIAYFIKATSGFINKIDALQKSSIQKINNNKPNEAISLLRSYNVKQEREALYRQFDEIFLRLFPTFVQDYNEYFPTEHVTILKKGELLNTELRIYALYRLGIKDSNQVADFLELSVTTIYTYKTRTKSRSHHKANFEEKILQIRSI